MSHGFSVSFVRGGFLLALVFGAIGGVRAEDKPATASVPVAPVEDSIAAAKRDFETIKATRDPALQPKNELPRMGVPEMRAGQPEAGTWSTPKATAAGKKSENWLLEAMEKSPEARKKDLERGKVERDRGSGAREKSDDEKFGQQRDSDANEASERKPTGAAVNPFSRFLGTWMTPQDYALLKPGLEQTIGAQIDTRSNAPASSATLTLPSLEGSNATFGSASSPRLPLGQTTPKENPYLPALLGPPPGPAASAPVFQPGPSALRSPAIPPLIDAAQTSPARSGIPDFVKPTADEKFFKQLKRF